MTEEKGGKLREYNGGWTCSKHTACIQEIFTVQFSCTINDKNFKKKNDSVNMVIFFFKSKNYRAGW
jgi:hypothetical protein